ncbi:MAG: aminobenzoyl-glutamate transporter [Phycisphaerae bacterium]|nr:aminobenzoyl-glutamate transporter [Phycisphaerae bacterium]MBM91305.1 aminobenzoyl-glutamate transporter [Phycisphaerae bacterium]
MPTPDQPAPNDTPRKGSFIARFLTFVEWLGNLLPHPVTLFALFALAIVIISAITSMLGVAVEDPRPGSEGVMITTNSLLAPDGIRWLFQNIVPNFSGFAPLGTVLVALLGVGVAERSGLLTAIIRGLILWAPPQLVTLVVIFAAVVSNTASEMGYVVIIPLAMVIFHALGRHPLAGMAAAFAGVSGGYSANILIGTVDPLLAGITQEAAQLIDPAYEVSPIANYYFMAASTFLVTGVGWLVTAKIVEPRLGPYNTSMGEDDLEPATTMDKLTALEKKGIKLAAATVALLTLFLIVLAGPRYAFLDWANAIPGWGVLRAPDTTLTGPESFRPLLRSVVTLIFIVFVIPGFVYGKVVGTMKNDRDIIHAMELAMRSMGLYIVLVFFAAQFVAFFKYTGLGEVLAVVGADALVAMNLDNPLVFIPFILMCCFVNLMLGSASAQWAATAPIFVPMLMTIGYSPEVIQAAYRIGDSTTNTVTPMMSYFGLILAVATRYKKDLGIGTMIATMLPYCIAMIICWIAFFYLWVFLLGWPVGPGSPTTYVLPT